MLNLVTYRYNDGNIIGGVRTNTITLDTSKCTIKYIVDVLRQHFTTFELVSTEPLSVCSGLEEEAIVLSYKYTKTTMPHACRPLEHREIIRTEVLNSIEELHEVLGRYILDLKNFEVLSINKL